MRVTFTTKLETTSNLATFESANRVAENLQFDRYDRVRIVNSSALFDHTNGTANGSSIRLSGSTNEKTGLVKTISVMPGDVINMEVWAKYLDKTQANWTPQLLQIVSPIMSGTTGIVTDGSNYPNNPSNTFPYTGLNNTGSSTGLGPKAYLNYIFFDRDFVATLPADDPSQTFYVRVPESAKESGLNLDTNPNGVDHALLSASVTVKKAGYLYIYLSNEEATPVEVYFDDFKVTQVKSPVVQMDDYYPFGLAFNSYSRENSVKQDVKYNGKEMLDELNLGWLDYGARMYESTSARWIGPDAFAEKYYSISHYAYVANSPLIMVDPNGKEIYYVNANGELKVAYKTMLRTKSGRELYNKYGKSKTDDIYLTNADFGDDRAHAGMTASDVNDGKFRYGFGVGESGKLSWKFGVGKETKAAFSPFNDIDFSRSRGKKIHLVSLANEDLEKNNEYISAEILFH